MPTMNCLINPVVNCLFQYQRTKNFFPDEDKCYMKDEKSCSEYNSRDISTTLPQMTPPTTASINTHFNTNLNLLISSSRYSPSLQSILNLNFVKSAKENYIQPIYDSNLQQVILAVECGQNHAFMYLARLCQGSKGLCILFKTNYWLTPNEFQYISGRETAKDWKRSIRHNGKSLKLLINKGILCVHSPLCECGTATSSFMKKGNQSQNPGDSFGSSFPMALSSSSAVGNDDIDSVGPQKMGWNNLFDRPHSSTSLGDQDSLGTEGSSPRSLDWNVCNESRNTSTVTVRTLDDNLRDNELQIDEQDSPLSRSLLMSAVETTAESQLEEPPLTGSAQAGGNEPGTPTVKSKRKSKQSVALKAERQSPQLSSSTTSPPMTPPPPTNSTGPNNSTGSSPPPQPIKQMEQMMSSSARNYSDFMRSLAAKYNQQQSNINNEYYSRASPAANFAFDSRFLKPGAAAALLNLSCSQIPSSMFLEKDKFPMIDMSSTQTLLSMVRSASAAAANNLESLKTNSQNKRPNSPLDLSARDLPSTPPPFKKSKLRNPLDSSLKAAASTTPCLSSCSTGCTEEAETMINWSVEEVCRFVSTIDLCKDYIEIFREHSIDGSSLPLLTEEHLMNAMNMKLGPALKFRSTVARKLGTCVVCSHCTHCHNHNNNTSAHSP